MANYKRPGVYIEESLNPLTNVVTNPGVAVAAFVASHDVGPSTPVKVSTWSQFVSAFGGFGSGGPLGFALYQFFSNGGRDAWVVRQPNEDAVAASVTINDRQGDVDHAVGLLTFTALSPGAGVSLAVSVEDTGTEGRFNLYVYSGGTAASNVVERFLDVSANPVDKRYVVGIVNSPLAGSAYVSVVNVSNGPWNPALTPALTTATAGALIDGSDGTGSPNLLAGLNKLNKVPGLLTVNLPGVTNTSDLNQAITWCETRGNAFLVIDAPPALGNSAATSSALVAYAGNLTKSSYAAVYGPQVIVDDPTSTVPGAVRTLPVGASVVGKFAFTDATRNVAKAAAGLDTGLSNVLALETVFEDGELDSLNVSGVNVVRSVPGAGFCIMGARTLATGKPDRYISVRRTLQFIETALKDGTRFAIFEPNDQDLWEQIYSACDTFLDGLDNQGIIKGYYVVCDETNNTPQTIEAGEVHAEVGVGLLGSAEFIVIKIGQYQASAA